LHNSNIPDPVVITLREQILSWLAQNVPPSRVKHILGVEQMARDLACHYQLDADKAAQAGLMHDLAKYFKPEKLLEMARAEGMELNEVDISNPHLLHADASAIVARNTFGIQDAEILDAIANHTLGRPQMSQLSCIVFLADALEPGRGDNPELERLRTLSRTDIYQAVWQSCDYSLKFLLSRRLLIHPRTIATRNWALEKSMNKSEVKSQKSEVC
jgi:predicted HD superfamily hydrolase involved in NAD metabolism